MPTNNKTPYSYQSEKHFWRTGMTNIKFGHEVFQRLHDLSINIDEVNIASVGSCFAQHVGRWLISNNYPFSQSKLDTKRESSFAFGNIYTPKCFLQWLNYNSQEPHRFDIYYCATTERYYDLLRPTIIEAGFTSKEALIQARDDAKVELYDTLKNCDLLIFTLGLTEAWKDIDDVFYPSCPGVIAGEFNEESYRFHEFHYNEILSDVMAIKEQLKIINPNINIILTVSPVPLTATATNKHILVANQYSKSTLRSVAGYLSNQDDCFTYFPSYEIITVNNENDFRFESNRRTVSMQGVNYVMQHFKKAFTEQNLITTQKLTSESSNEVACEEEQLDAIKKLEKTKATNSTEILTVIGDSHMGKLSTALTRLGISHCGGMIMNGSGFAQKKFGICSDEYFVPLENAHARKLWAPVLTNLKMHQQESFQQLSIVISNIGLQTHQTIGRLKAFLQGQGVTDFTNVSHQQFVHFFEQDQFEQLSILLNIKKSGHQVIVVSDTPFCQHFKESKHAAGLIYAYYDALERILSDFGVPFLNIARIFDNEIADPMNYASTVVYDDGSNDWFHGGDKYYEWLAEKLIKDIILPVMEP